jgi:hypothetical protein
MAGNFEKTLKKMCTVAGNALLLFMDKTEPFDNPHLEKYLGHHHQR